MKWEDFFEGGCNVEIPRRSGSLRMVRYGTLVVMHILHISCGAFCFGSGLAIRRHQFGGGRVDPATGAAARRDTTDILGAIRRLDGGDGSRVAGRPWHGDLVPDAAQAAGGPAAGGPSPYGAGRVEPAA